MIIKRFQGKTEDEATDKAREELGSNVVVMNVKMVKPKGLFRFFKASVYEVTAAKEEEETGPIPSKAMMSPLRAHDLQSHDNINMLADEKLNIPWETKSTADSAGQGMSSNLNSELLFGGKRPSELSAEPELAARKKAPPETNGLEEKLENLQSLLEKKLVSGEIMESEDMNALSNDQPALEEGFAFIKMIYGIMLANEVNEKYVNQIIDEVEKIMRKGTSVDYILSNMYQKMILKLGQPQVIEISEKKPKIVFFVGPTGVGKTTTIAKIASKFKMEYGKKVALLTADTYRIAAAEQLRTYANILDTPLTIVYSSDELNETVERVLDYDLVLVDTAGFSHRNTQQGSDVKALVEGVNKKYEKEIYLVLSATTKYQDLLDIADTFKNNFDFKMIFTKLDETSCYGNIFNMKMYTGAQLSYSTYGQNVPDDIEEFDTQKMVKLLLGGK
jgi:flagellar biosynthesis protein FlhF